MEMAEEKVSELEEWSLEIIQSVADWKKLLKKMEQNLRNQWNNTK